MGAGDRHRHPRLRATGSGRGAPRWSGRGRPRRDHLIGGNLCRRVEHHRGHGLGQAARCTGSRRQQRCASGGPGRSNRTPHAGAKRFGPAMACRRSPRIPPKRERRQATGTTGMWGDTAVMLDGRTVVVAGVGPGLGRAIVETSARQGANVVAAARTAERLADIVRGLPDPARALAVSADISDLASCRHLAELAVDRFGGIDGVVNNAVWLPASAPMPDTMEADWSRAFDVNVTGPWRVVMASLDALAAW